MALGEAPELQRRQIRPRRARGGEVRPRRADEEDPRRRALLYHPPEQLQRGGVAPVEILHQEHERLNLAERQGPRREQLDRLPPLNLRAHPQRGVALGRRETQEGSHQRRRLAKREFHGREATLKLLNLRRRRVVGRESQALLEQLDHRVEGCGLRVRRPPAFKPRVRHRDEVLAELVDQAGLPDAGLPADEHRLPLPLLDSFP